MISPIDQVRAACAEVASRARFVQIVDAAIAPYAAALPIARVERPSHDAATHFLGHGPATASFFLTLDSINFGSGYFPHLAKRPGMSGYFTVASRLTDYCRASGPPDAAQLASASAPSCAAIFGQDLGDPAMAELMELFASAWRDLGALLLSEYGGDPVALIAAADASAAGLVAILARMPLFQDVARYDDFDVPLYKRAQIAAADLWIAFDGTGLGRFDDIDDLTIFADNLVPHVLRLDGVLRYEPGLAARIDAELPIAPGSPEETELRAVALHAVELMVAELRTRGGRVNAMQIDNLLWNRGQQPAYKQASPRHRARSVFY